MAGAGHHVAGRRPRPVPADPAALDGGGRGYRVLFAGRDRVDFAETLLWRRGETAVRRLHAMPANASAARAARDAMLPQLDGLDRWIPHLRRQRLCDAVHCGAITLERMELPDVPVRNLTAMRHLGQGWEQGRPLRRAGRAVLAYLEQRGINPDQVHLHERDLIGPHLRYFVGFKLRYFRLIPERLAEHSGTEWIEVVHPSCVQPIHALRIVAADRSLLAAADWS